MDRPKLEISPSPGSDCLFPHTRGRRSLKGSIDRLPIVDQTTDPDGEAGGSLALLLLYHDDGDDDDVLLLPIV